jgi:hypothetical protein
MWWCANFGTAQALKKLSAWLVQAPSFEYASWWLMRFIGK